jgi:hypothetical protein
MKIALCHSFYNMDLVEKAIEIKGRLTKMGHTVFAAPFLEISAVDLQNLLSDKDYVERTKPKLIKEHFGNILESDAILVVNLDKNGIKNYIGGSTFAEIIFAFYNNKKIFLFNPIPEEIDIFNDELKAVKPIVINGNLNLIL